MRGGSSWVGVVWRGLGKKTSHSSYSSPPKYPSVLPDAWIPSTKHHRLQSSGIFPSGHTAAIIDGKSIARDIRFRIAGEIRRAKAATGKSPGLAVVLVGKRRDSKTCINIKLRACDEIGIATLIAELPENCTETELLDVVSGLNEDPSVHGIIVQLPLPQRHHATVSTVHAFTKNPEQITSQADIVITDVGIPNIVRGHWLKPGAVVIDMGTNLVKDPNSRHGFRVTGDVCFEEAIKVVSAITPVPGGVGPVTISMLLSNTLDSAKRAFGFSST
ncbi:hypothetical protein FH972_015604 [Carpinus fangiana]|uniref:Tetrahydrofolate dehydrogenase/cyclohydrolase NAD(P)-binding domain-containing protein n=1 Tax=Carpinus fangiana TaxID=176857 RepID=A0A5N6RGV8_9ROSI|nr:hypothetical protein FH972_015604 [Carpinus fangiana]